MHRLLLIIAAIILSITAAYSQCITNVDFNTWSKTGQPGNGNWVVQSSGAQVWQTINGDNTYFISPYDLMNVRITGNFRSTDNDDDWMGFVFSFLNPMGPIDVYDCWLFDWKQDWQGASPKGMSLCRIDGVIPPANYGATFSAHQNTPEFRVVQDDFGGPGWNRNFNHSFELRLTYTRATIYVDGNLIFDHFDCYKPGRFGFYNKSQEDCYYTNFQYDLYVDFTCTEKVCLGDAASFDFISPCATSGLNQYQSVTWNFGDNSNPVVINNPTASNVNVTHTYTAPGTYTATLTVTDNNGCSASATRQVEVRVPITLTPSYTQPLCNGSSNGSISVTASGGFGNYSYSWNGSVLTPLINGITAGTYNVVVTDGYCSTTQNYTLTQPTAVTATSSHTDASCGSNNGSVSLTISGGTPPYQNVTWAGVLAAGGPNTYNRTGLPAGLYIANFTDANGCSAVTQYRETVAALPCGINSNVTKTNVSCFGGNNGSITLAVTGGAGGARINWTGPSGFTFTSNSNTSTISNLVAGTYNYTYTDNVAGNTFSGNVIIAQPGAAMVADINTIGISCAGVNNGQATASVISGGVGPYTFAWNGGAPGNNPVLAGQGPGQVSVIVTDSRGCTATASGVISPVPSLAVNITTVMDSCFNSGRGSALAHVTGGTPPYTFAWNNFSTDSANLNLIAGTYTVTVTDRNNCTVSAAASVSGPSAPFTYAFSMTHILCNGDNTGGMTITPSGGTPGYTIQWNPGSVSGFSQNALAAGIYNFTVTDVHDCVVYGGDTLFEPDSALTVVSAHEDILCYGANNGSLTLTVSGGIEPYLYQGNPIAAGDTVFSNLAPGTYADIITDANGCTAAFSETINEPAGPQSLDITATDNVCSGGTIGTATATFINATGNVVYDWNPGGVLPGARTGLSAGTYAVTATDANNCSFTGSVTIAEPAAPVLNVITSAAPCFGDSGTAAAIPVGGTAPFLYTWSNTNGTFSFQTPDSLVLLPAGDYMVTAADAVPCNQVAVFTVTQPDAIAINETLTNIRCFGETNGSITLNVNGGTGNFSYNWNPNVSATNAAQQLAAGDYAITVLDGVCSEELTLTLTEPPLLDLDASATDAACFGENTGAIAATATGGTPAHNFTLLANGAAIQQSATGQFAAVAAGTYTVAVQDASQCVDSFDVAVGEPVLLAGTVSVEDETCYQFTDGSITVFATGGTPDYTFSLSPSEQNTSGLFTGLGAGTYTITITDASGCTTTQQTNVAGAPPLTVVIQPETSIQIKGGGTVQLEATSNQTGALTYSWQPLQGLSCYDCANPVFNGTTSGSYTVDVSNENGCVSTAQVDITVIPNYDVYTPNAFTPDGDGVNDDWKIYGFTNNIKTVNILVFNRWGEKVFETNDINTGWDGRHKGALVVPDVYVYYAKITWLDFHPDTHMEGSVTVIR